MFTSPAKVIEQHQFDITRGKVIEQHQFDVANMKPTAKTYEINGINNNIIASSCESIDQLQAASSAGPYSCQLGRTSCSKRLSRYYDKTSRYRNDIYLLLIAINNDLDTYQMGHGTD